MTTRRRRTAREKARSPRRRRGGSGRNRTWVYAAVLLLLVVPFIWLLYHFKDYTPKEESDPFTAESSPGVGVKAVNDALVKAFFDVGISSEHVVSERAYSESKGGVSWRRKAIVVNLPRGVDAGRLRGVFGERLGGIEGVEWGFNEGQEGIGASIEMFGRTTHSLTFKRYSPSRGGAAERPGKERRPSSGGAALASLPKKSIPKLPSLPSGGRRPKIAIIVDDLGGDRWSVDRFLEIPADLSFAVLPYLPFSRYAAEEASRRGRDVILHLPMEPKISSGYTGLDAGESALLVGLPKEEIVSKLEDNLASVPHVIGVNNHMGSKFTENDELMTLVLGRLRERGLFFVDSRTTSESRGYRLARKLGVRTAERDVFIDEAARRPEHMRSQLEKLVSVSKAKGIAIGICHPYPETLEMLSQEIPRLKKQVEIVPISQVVK